MGAWGADPFANDAAIDLLGELEDITSPDEAAERLVAAMRAVVESDRYLENPEVQVALAAAALVALRLGGSPAEHSRSVDEFIESSSFEASGELRELAARTFDRAFIPDQNEWYEIWDDENAIPQVGQALEPYRRAISGPRDA